jgi:hypothetical protein
VNHSLLAVRCNLPERLRGSEMLKLRRFVAAGLVLGLLAFAGAGAGWKWQDPGPGNGNGNAYGYGNGNAYGHDKDGSDPAP